MSKLLTLCFIHQGDRILLGLKKKGLGVNRWNGFGGKVEPGETIREAAVREVQEEVGVNVTDLIQLGVLNYSFQNKPDLLEVHVFKTTRFNGEPLETEEMRPQWFNTDQISYDQMWSGDKYWLPLLLQNQKFEGSFVMDEKDIVVEHKLTKL